MKILKRRVYKRKTKIISAKVYMKIVSARKFHKLDTSSVGYRTLLRQNQSGFRLSYHIMAGKRRAEKGKKTKKRKIKKSSLQEMEERAKLSWSPRTNVIEDIIQVSKNTLKNFRCTKSLSIDSRSKNKYLMRYKYIYHNYRKEKKNINSVLTAVCPRSPRYLVAAQLKQRRPYPSIR